MKPLNKHEGEIYDIIVNHYPAMKNLYRQPLEFVEAIKKHRNKLAIYQSPRLLINDDIYHIDFSLIDKNMDIHTGIEVMSLSNKKSCLSNRINILIYNHMVYPENNFVYILLGEGFSDNTDTMMGFNRLIAENSVELTICRSVEEFNEYINNLYRLTAVS